MKISRMMRAIFQQLVVPVVFIAFLVAATTARGATAYYSSGTPISSTLANNCATLGCTGNISTSVSTPAGSTAISAAVSLPSVTGGKATLRYQLLNGAGTTLDGTGLAGYRAGILLSVNNSLLSLSGLGTVTIRTYLSSAPTVVQDQLVVSAAVAQATLLAGKGYPVQFELLSKKDFNQVEIELGSVASVGTTTINVHYAYAVGPLPATQVVGLTSNSASAGTVGTASVSGGCDEKISNPDRAVDFSQANYATFGSLASVLCKPQLKVKLSGTAPAGYLAGFVVGQGSTLLDASALDHLTLKTYKNGVLKETLTGSALLGLSVLPDNKSMLTFKSTTAFDEVAIERSDAVSLLDNLQVYYGVGVPATTPPLVISSFSTDAASHQNFDTNGVCVGCSVSSNSNAAGDPNAATTISVGAGILNTARLRLDLNGTGAAGNRAGMVLGNSTLLDVAALSRMTLITYDASGNVMESATGSSLLTVNVMPNGRQTVSFNTTRPFAKVAVQMGGVANLVTNTDIYYAFSDNTSGALNIIPPTGPLPVTLISFGARRVAGGAAALSWATASEVNSASFVVERSTNPAAGFEVVGTVAAAGSSTAMRTYTLQDNAAATQVGTLYYRLRQLDMDGQAHLSAVVVLAAGPSRAGFSLYPNPAPAGGQQVVVSSPDLEAGYSVSLYSSLGQLLHSEVVSAEGATTQVPVPITGLAGGIYQVVVRDASGQRVSSQRLQVSGQ